MARRSTSCADHSRVTCAGAVAATARYRLPAPDHSDKTRRSPSSSTVSDVEAGMSGAHRVQVLLHPEPVGGGERLECRHAHAEIVEEIWFVLGGQVTD